MKVDFGKEVVFFIEGVELEVDVLLFDSIVDEDVGTLGVGRRVDFGPGICEIIPAAIALGGEAFDVKGFDLGIIKFEPFILKK